MRAGIAGVIIIGVVGSLALGCRNALGPAEIAGTYALQFVADDPLPAELYRNDYYAVRVPPTRFACAPTGPGQSPE